MCSAKRCLLALRWLSEDRKTSIWLRDSERVCIILFISILCAPFGLNHRARSFFASAKARNLLVEKKAMRMSRCFHVFAIALGSLPAHAACSSSERSHAIRSASLQNRRVDMMSGFGKVELGSVQRLKIHMSLAFP
jgi:hypothetical protein